MARRLRTVRLTGSAISIWNQTNPNNPINGNTLFATEGSEYKGKICVQKDTPQGRKAAWVDPQDVTDA